MSDELFILKATEFWSPTATEDSSTRAEGPVVYPAQPNRAGISGPVFEAEGQRPDPLPTGGKTGKPDSTRGPLALPRVCRRPPPSPMGWHVSPLCPFASSAVWAPSEHARAALRTTRPNARQIGRIGSLAAASPAASSVFAGPDYDPSAAVTWPGEGAFLRYNQTNPVRCSSWNCDFLAVISEMS